MVMFHASGLPLVHGICVAPSGLLPSDLDKPTDSLTAGYCAFFTDLQMISFIWACRICLGALFLHDKPCRPCASTIEPQRQLCGWHVLLPRRKPTAIRMSSSYSRSPTAVMGGACSQSSLLRVVSLPPLIWRYLSLCSYRSPRSSGRLSLRLECPRLSECVS